MLPSFRGVSKDSSHFARPGLGCSRRYLFWFCRARSRFSFLRWRRVGSTGFTPAASNARGHGPKCPLITLTIELSKSDFFGKRPVSCALSCSAAIHCSFVHLLIDMPPYFSIQSTTFRSDPQTDPPPQKHLVKPVTLLPGRYPDFTACPASDRTLHTVMVVATDSHRTSP